MQKSLQVSFLPNPHNDGQPVNDRADAVAWQVTLPLGIE